MAKEILWFRDESRFDKAGKVEILYRTDSEFTFVYNGKKATVPNYLIGVIFFKTPNSVADLSKPRQYETTPYAELKKDFYEYGLATWLKLYGYYKEEPITKYPRYKYKY